MDEVKAKRPTYSDEFKRDAVRLVVEEGYSFKAACQAVGVCDATLRAWHRKLAPPPEPCGDGATVDELRDEARAPSGPRRFSRRSGRSSSRVTRSTARRRSSRLSGSANSWKPLVATRSPVR